MRKIKELGLELIELQDEVLLVKKRTGAEKGLTVFIDGAKHKFTEIPLDGIGHLVIASTKAREALPLLVIKDEVEELGNVFSNGFQLYLSLNNVKYLNEGFKAGYNKAKETYKFTEEDLRNAFWFGKAWALDCPEEYIEHNYGIQNSDSMNDDQVFEAFTKVLSKKELYIETCAHCIVCDKGHDKSNRCRQVRSEISICSLRLDSFPKVENNQIKVVWK